MNLEQIRIVLVETSHPGNIGSTARAMKTMGLNALYLVNPKHLPEQKAREMAAGADDVLAAATVVDSLEAAIGDCHLVLGTSARPRGISLPGLTPHQAAALVVDKTQAQRVAIVFGREHSGLNNDELLQCHFHIHIPSNPEYSSLNLSQAVQILAYELRMKALAPEAEVALSQDSLAPVAEVEQFYTQLQKLLVSIKFLNPANPRRLMPRVRRLFNRARLEQMELNILRGMVSQLQYVMDYNTTRKHLGQADTSEGTANGKESLDG